MGAFKHIFEPGSIAVLFILGAIVNRTPRGSSAAGKDAEDRVSPTNGKARSSEKHPNSTFRQSSRRNNVATRFLTRFPFVVEALYWNLTYWGYQVARALAALRIRDDRTVHAKAIWHALQILSLEKDLGIAIEKDLQILVLSNLPSLMRFFALIYHSHIIVGVVFIVYAYTYMPFPRYASIRRTIFLDNWIAFAILSSWRCMPPRLLPQRDFGMIDVLHPNKNAGPSWSNNRFQLTIAAMPSLHFGTSMLIAWSLWRFSPHRSVRAVCWLWPSLMLLTILATANHWILDAFVGALVPVLSWRLNGVMLSLSHMEASIFRALRLEKPDVMDLRQRRGFVDANELV